jgi:hypothetical protein
MTPPFGLGIHVEPAGRTTLCPSVTNVELRPRSDAGHGPTRLAPGVLTATAFTTARQPTSGADSHGTCCERTADASSAPCRGDGPDPASTEVIGLHE